MQHKQEIKIHLYKECDHITNWMSNQNGASLEQLFVPVMTLTDIQQGCFGWE